MIEYPSEGGRGRSNDPRSKKTVSERGRHAQISNKARTVDRVNQTRITQGRAKKEEPMTEETVCVGVDVAKGTLDMALSNSTETRQFKNDYEGINSAVSYIAGLKPTIIILEATGHFEIPLAAALQTKRLPVVIVNPPPGTRFRQSDRGSCQDG